MSSKVPFPSLTGWEPTRETLHWYSKAVGVVPRAHAQVHPKWWHISLKVRPDGLVTDNMSLPGRGIFALKMDLLGHKVVLFTSEGESREFNMTDGLSATAFGDQVLGAVGDLGLSEEYARDGKYAREKFENDEPRQYDPAAAEKYFTAVVSADRVFNKHRAGLSGEVGPVQLWPHGFDLAVEWFGTRTVEYEEGGQIKKYPSQLNLGFSPGESTHPEPYFYSNPWPFEKDQLVTKPLPAGARWFTESWQGSVLEYALLADDKSAEDKLLDYARAVHEIAAPTLME
jgi:hypothetical protein